MDEFDKILRVIKHHADGSDTALETLTRLFRKNQSDESLPSLDRTNVRCWEDERAKPWFCGLCNNVETGKVATQDSGDSIVVLIRNRKEFILDGHKRCRLWYERQEQDNHTALFIEPH